MSFEQSGDNFKQRTASVGERSSMNVMRAMSRDSACSDRPADDADDADDDSLGKCHILTVLSAAAVTKPPRGKSGNLRETEHASRSKRHAVATAMTGARDARVWRETSDVPYTTRMTHVHKVLQ
jgi:hypothetical protein